mgnify:FL=1
MDGSKKWITPAFGVMGLLFATGTAVPASGSSDSTIADSQTHLHQYPRAGSQSGLDRNARMLAAHNAERHRLRLEPLKWSNRLEREAKEWARHLSRKGVLQHADLDMRNGTGENLWMGTAGHWPVETMVAKFLEEKQHYKHAHFPHNSKTGNWADVGHYTQIVWRETREVGCALATDLGSDILVCRYWPAGNVWGRKAY